MAKHDKKQFNTLIKVNLKITLISWFEAETLEPESKDILLSIQLTTWLDTASKNQPQFIAPTSPPPHTLPCCLVTSVHEKRDGFQIEAERTDQWRNKYRSGRVKASPLAVY